MTKGFQLEGPHAVTLPGVLQGWLSDTVLGDTSLSSKTREHHIHHTTMITIIREFKQGYKQKLEDEDGLKSRGTQICR